MNNTLNKAITLLSLILLLVSCNGKWKQGKGPKQSYWFDNFSKTPEFGAFIKNFQEIKTPYNFNKSWEDLRNKEKVKVDINNQFLNNSLVRDSLLTTQEMYCAYKIMFNSNYIGLIYSAQDAINYQLLLVIYSKEGIAVSAETIHGVFNDSKYKYGCIIDKEYNINVYDSVLTVKNGMLVSKFRGYKKLIVSENGDFEANRPRHKKSERPPTPKKASIIGIWLDASVVSSGLGTTITFFKDGSYIDRKAENDFLNRTIYTKGKWKLYNDTLELQPKKVGEIEGGTIVDDSISGEKIIDGGKIVEAVVATPITTLNPVILTYSDDFQKEQLSFDTLAYYKLDKNPENTNYWNYSTENKPSPNKFYFLERIADLSHKTKFKADTTTGGISVAESGLEKQILEALGKIPSEEPKLIELPDTSGCENRLIGKKKIGEDYLLIVKTYHCDVEHTSLSGLIISANKTILAQFLLAGYIGEKKGSTELSTEFSAMNAGILKQLVVKKSFNSRGKVSQTLENKYSFILTSKKDGKKLVLVE